MSKYLRIFFLLLILSATYLSSIVITMATEELQVELKAFPTYDPLTIYFRLYVSGGTPPYQGTLDFGDGSEAPIITDSPGDLTALHTYNIPGLYRAIMNIVDGKGESAGAFAVVSVGRKPTSLSVSVDKMSYSRGESITITSILKETDSGASLGGKAVTGYLTLFGGSTRTLSFQETGNGLYKAIYTVFSSDPSGQWTATSIFSGDNTYEPSNGTSPPFVVNPEPDFSISINPNNGTVQQGGWASTTITVMSVNGYNRIVSLIASEQPSGISVSFVPSEGTPSFTSTMTIQVGSSVEAGTYSIEVVGSGTDGKEHFISFVLTVYTNVVVFSASGMGGDASGTVLIIDGIHYSYGSLPRTFNWDMASSHSFEWTSPIAVGSGKRYIWASSSGLSESRNGEITVPSGGGLVSASYMTQYYLKVDSQHGNPTGDGWYDADSTVFSSVTSPSAEGAAIQYICTGWTGSGSVPPTGSGSRVTFLIDVPTSIKWNWAIHYRLIIKATTGGSVMPIPREYWHDSGAEVLVNATPSTSYVLYFWELDGVRINPANTYSVTMNSPHILEAVFWLKKSIDVSYGGQVYEVQVFTNSSLPLAKSMSQQCRLSLQMEGPLDTKGSAEVLIPLQLIKDIDSDISRIMVFIDGVQIGAISTVEGEFIKVSFDYMYGTKKIDLYYESYIVTLNAFSQIMGYSIPMAQVRITSSEGGLSLVRETGGDGRLQVQLPPLDYEFEVSYWGFSIEKRIALNGDISETFTFLFYWDAVVTFFLISSVLLLIAFSPIPRIRKRDQES